MLIQTLTRSDAKETKTQSRESTSFVKCALFVKRPVLQVLFVNAVVGRVGRFLKELEQISFKIKSHAVSSAEDFVLQVATTNYDIILVKAPVPAWWEGEALKFHSRNGEEIPVIFLNSSRRKLERPLAEGLINYAVIREIGHLSTAIRRVLGMKALGMQRAKAERKLRNTLAAITPQTATPTCVK